MGIYTIGNDRFNRYGVSGNLASYIRQDGMAGENDWTSVGNRRGTAGGSQKCKKGEARDEFFHFVS